ncbi:DUF523 domain-containing protein [uncultured Microbulbifer sp.]|uniref:DUF523 domain-containing protein n=1 Tax=uncultured Microbulbifer sp. TaxID=348147 RepID=UPI00261564AF|nr:DUF523 domain-containing protein [uncultured Microbulbifer sp.]
MRYNGSDIEVISKDFNWLVDTQGIVPLCPEVSAGLSVPRAPAEICGGSGAEVLVGMARVIGSGGDDLADQFLLGTDVALRLCRDLDIKFAVLIETTYPVAQTLFTMAVFQA